MIRTALRPGWLALLALLVVVVVSFYQLGMWQLGVSSNKAARELAATQAARPTQPLSTVTGPHEQFPADGAGMPVSVTGEYDASLQFLVPGRLLDGVPGYWVVTPLRTGDSGESALLPVVRGFVTEPGQADRPEAPTDLELTGTLAPSESDVTTGSLPAGQRGAIDSADLVNLWDEPIYNGFLFLVDETPSVTSTDVTRVPPPVFGESGIDPRNVGYALQWFVFALFAVYMYYRFLRQATRPPAPPRPEPPGNEHAAPEPAHTATATAHQHSGDPA